MSPKLLRIALWIFLAGLGIILFSWLEEKTVGRARGQARGMLGLR